MLNKTIANRYEVVRLLGSGGMADVYLAKDNKLGRQVALKMLQGRFASGPEFLERFHREARSAAGLSHPHIVAVHDQGECPEGHYIVMEYLKGWTLGQVIEAKGSLTPEQAINIALQVLSALAFAHQHGVIHRDIKPQNIVIDDAGQVKVTDFGIARAADAAEKLTQDGSILGTAHYLSPEQARGQEVVIGSDLYSCGVVLFEMLAGRVPFEGDNFMAVIHRHLTEEPPLLKELDTRIPINLSNTVANALIKDSRSRYQSAAELMNDLNRCLREEGVAPRPTAPALAATQVTEPQGPQAADPAPSQTIIVNTLSCPQCGEPNPVGAKFCQGCGEGLGEMAIAPAGGPARSATAGDRLAPPTFSDLPPAPAPAARNSYPSWAPFALVPVVLLIAVGGFLFMSRGGPEGGGSDSPVPPPNTPPAQTTAPDVEVAQPYVPKFHGSLANTGDYENSNGDPTGVLAGKFTVGDKIISSPVVEDKAIFFGSNDGNLYSVDVDSLALKWKFKTGNFVLSTPAVKGGSVVFGSWDGNLYAVDSTSGVQQWVFQAGDAIGSSPVIDEGTVYVGSWDSKLYAINVNTGAKKWEFKTADKVYSSPAIANGTIYFGSNDNNLYALDAATGQKKWSFTAGADVGSSPAIANGTVFFGSEDGNLYAVDASNGQEKWRFKTSSLVNSSPAVDGGVVYCGSDDFTLYAIDANSGTAKWTFKTGSNVYSSPVINHGVVFAASNDKSMYAVDAATGQKKWQFSTGDIVNSSAALVNGVLYFGSNDGNLYALR